MTFAPTAGGFASGVLGFALDALPRRARPPRACSRRVLLALALAGAAGCSSPSFGTPPTGPTPQRGAVVSEHPLATRVGLQILEEGGNAADAAVATALALAVVYPQAGNLGGGGFALWVPHGGEPRALDFRETAPAAATPERFLEDLDGELVVRSLDGPLAAGVPGTPLGLFELHQWAGVLSWRRVVAPAVQLAREGFDVDPWLASSLNDPALRTRLEASPGARTLFYPHGEPLRTGTRLVQPSLARTLERLGERGPDAFYRGVVAEALVDDVQAGGGLWSLADLEGYRTRERDPLIGWFRGKQVVTMPPPSSGGVILLMVLRILDGFPLDTERARTLAFSANDELVLASPESYDRSGIGERAVHWWIEAMRAGFAERAVHMGDPDYWDVPTEQLLSQAWINRRRIAIGERANPELTAWDPALLPRDGETTHLCTLDVEGNAVSLTTTLNTTFGSGHLVPEVGILLNNEMDDFALAAGVPNTYGLLGAEANAIEPGKRPLSSMTPVVVRDEAGVAELIVGAPGGPRIITAVTQVILRVMVYEQSLENAIRAPRVHQQWRQGGEGDPTRTLVESGWPEDFLADLRARGHDLQTRLGRTFWASVQGIAVEPAGAEPEAFSDPRRGGVGGVVGRPLPSPARP